MADELENTPCALMGEAMARYKHDELTAGEAVSIILEQAKRLSPAPEAVAWREKVAQTIEDHVEAERRGPGEGWLEVVGIYDAADAILALIATLPTQGGEG